MFSYLQLFLSRKIFLSKEIWQSTFGKSTNWPWKLMFLFTLFSTASYHCKNTLLIEEILQTFPLLCVPVRNLTTELPFHLSMMPRGISFVWKQRIVSVFTAVLVTQSNFYNQTSKLCFLSISCQFCHFHYFSALTCQHNQPHTTFVNR